MQPDVKGYRAARHEAALHQVVAEGFLTAEQAQLEADTWKAFDMFSFLFRTMDYEEGNPVAVLSSEILPGTADDMRAWLASLPRGDKKYLQLNSPGGSAVTGVALMNMIKADGNVDVVVHGTAFSAASILLQGANERILLPGTSVGIHRSWGVAIGNAAALRQQANQMDSVDLGMTEIYMMRVGKKATEQEIRSLMEEESLLARERAVALGLADTLMETCPTAGMKMPNEKAQDDDDERPDYEFGAKASPAINSYHLAELV